jgi:hypothetical protein
LVYLLEQILPHLQAHGKSMKVYTETSNILEKLSSTPLSKKRLEINPEYSFIDKCKSLKHIKKCKALILVHFQSSLKLPKLQLKR